MLPKSMAALFEPLRFRDARVDHLRSLSDSDWRRLIAVCDSMHLTLPLEAACEGLAAANSLPEWVRNRMAMNVANTLERSRLVASSYNEIDAQLRRAGLPFVVLKGFANFPDFIPDPSRRVQYDLDLFLQLDCVKAASEQLRQLGYKPIQELASFPTDHLPVMVRKTGWEWRGDYYDPEIPISVDLHFRLWDEETERFAAPGWEDFWDRRTEKDCQGLTVPAFSADDALGYHCLHLLRHVLRGSLRLAHVHELGYFLHRRAKDEGFWEGWRATHPPRLRQLQAITFGLAREWFRCDLSDVAEMELEALPEPLRMWLRHYGYAPAATAMRPNKHELWLHLALLDSWRSRRRTFMRRVFPEPARGPSGAALLAETQLSWRVWLKHEWRLVVHQLRRIVHHVRVLPGVAWHGAAWMYRLRFGGTRTGSAPDNGRA